MPRGSNHWAHGPKRDEIRKQLSEMHKGKRYSPNTEFKKGQNAWNKGKKSPWTSARLKVDNPMHNIETRWKMIDSQKGENSLRWNGGSYRYYHQEARRVVERELGRKLDYAEVVHHVDGDMTNNDIGNLRVIPTTAEHSRLHARLRRELKNK